MTLSFFFLSLCLFCRCVVGVSSQFACFSAEDALNDSSFEESSSVSFSASSSSSEGLRDGARVRRCLCGGSGRTGSRSTCDDEWDKLTGDKGSTRRPGFSRDDSSTKSIKRGGAARHF